MEQRGVWTCLPKIGMAAAGIAGAVIVYKIARGFAAGWSASMSIQDPMPNRADEGFEAM